jgi:hypothetical protein
MSSKQAYTWHAAAACDCACLHVAATFLQPVTHLIFLSSRAGNNYEVPAALSACLAALGELNTANVPQQLACEDSFGGKTNYRDSILAVSMATGKIK